MPKKDGKREINWQDAGQLKEDQIPKWAEYLREFVFKEIPELTFRTPHDGREEELADASLYGLWYRFLKANKKEYPPPAGLPAKDPRVVFYRKFGDLHEDFTEWWRLHGREAFRETKPYPFVRVLQQIRLEKSGTDDPLEGFVRPFDREIDFQLGVEEERCSDVRPSEEGGLRSIVVEIPMTISRALILQQLEEVLRALHVGDKLLRHEASTARLKLHPKRRYDLHVYEKLLAVWKFYEESAEDDTWWQIGERAKVDPALSPERTNDPRDKAANQEALGRLTQLMHAKAEKMMANAIRGTFPSD